MISKEQLDKWQNLADAATPGPWEVGGPHPGTSVIVETDPGGGSIYNGTAYPPEYAAIAIIDQRKEGEPNAEARAEAAFIATSRAAVPDLIAEVRRLQEENKALNHKLSFAALIAADVVIFQHCDCVSQWCEHWDQLLEDVDKFYKKLEG